MNLTIEQQKELQRIAKGLNGVARQQSKLVKELRELLREWARHYEEQIAKLASEDSTVEQIMEEVEGTIKNDWVDENEPAQSPKDVEETKEGEVDLDAVEEEIQENREVL